MSVPETTTGFGIRRHRTSAISRDLDLVAIPSAPTVPNRNADVPVDSAHRFNSLRTASGRAFVVKSCHFPSRPSIASRSRTADQCYFVPLFGKTAPRSPGKREHVGWRIH